MIVYVETNFVVEFVFRQSEYDSCDALRQMAEEGEIELHIPALAVAEAADLIRKTHTARQALVTDLNKHLARSAHLQESVPSLEVLKLHIVESLATEEQLLWDLREFIRTRAVTVPYDREALDWSWFFDLTKAVQGRSDTMILGSIFADAKRKHLGGTESIFVTKDRKDFSGPDVREHLKSAGCKLLFSFADSVAYLRHRP